jgi:rRNA maturation endonuclease Nob1
MKYLLDTNVFDTAIIRLPKRNDLFVIQDVADELENHGEEIAKIKTGEIKILDMTKRHFDKLAEVMVKHGDNLELINLYSGKGTADVAALAYILAERDNSGTLFPEEYTLVTRDGELSTVAQSYGIKCVSVIP